MWSSMMGVVFCRGIRGLLIPANYAMKLKLLSVTPTSYVAWHGMGRRSKERGCKSKTRNGWGVTNRGERKRDKRSREGGRGEE